MNIESFTNIIEKKTDVSTSEFIATIILIMLSRDGNIINNLSVASISLRASLNDIIDSTSSISKFSLSKFENASLSGIATYAIAEQLRLTKFKFSQMIDSVIAELGQLHFVSTVVNDIKILQRDIKNIINKRLVYPAKIMIGDNIHFLDSIITGIVGKEQNIDKYKYEGPLDVKNRNWCRNHVGKVLTHSQIMDWNKSSWTGKISGNPFVYRGGWGCRHYFIPFKGEKK